MSDQVIADAQSGGPPPVVAASFADAGAAASAADAAVTERAKEMLMQTVPWRRGIGWPVLGIEGLLAIGVGIYIVLQPEDARSVVRVFLGAFLVLNSLIRILQGFRENPRGLPGTPYRLVTGGIGLTVGVIVVLEPVSDFITDDAARIILALGFLAFGVIGLAAAVVTRESGGMRKGTVITGVLYTVFAVLLFYNVRRNSLSMELFGAVFIVLGVLLLGYAYMLLRAAKAGDTQASAAAV